MVFCSETTNSGFRGSLWCVPQCFQRHTTSKLWIGRLLFFLWCAGRRCHTYLLIFALLKQNCWSLWPSVHFGKWSLMLCNIFCYLHGSSKYCSDYPGRLHRNEKSYRWNELCAFVAQFIIGYANQQRTGVDFYTMSARASSQAGTHAIREQSEAQLALTYSIVPAFLVQCQAH